MGRVLLTGGSGFVGSAALHALVETGADVVAMVHQRPLRQHPMETVRGDLARPETLDDAFRDVDTLVHLASHIGEDERRCDETNARGTEALVRRAVSSGVQRIVYLSNAAVYGFETHVAAREAETSPRPASPVSRSRVAAENAVLRAGGVVLRPLFVYGPGDERFVPNLLRAARKLPILPNGGRARLSTIGVTELGIVIARVALAEVWRPGIYHVTDGRPVTLRAILDVCADLYGIPRARLSLPYGLAKLVVSGLAPGALGARHASESARHRLFLVCHDHTYDDSKLRSWIAVPPAESLPTQLQLNPHWYASTPSTSRSSWAR